ncbi:FecR family protein [Winogradskyella jejuensis]|uniref:FecR family protein n=1 Tax=Winogradskyella jejuensis TaxID=1089305 RepID=A0A1M5RUS4_9FLAO|nr:FecR domain-containing protein [Winogradskyella jejuensis]SHH29919.1 FecR family protein [Winogradskyella jejuensis]
MEREDLIKKWLDYNLNPEEQKAFEALEDYEQLIKLSKSSEAFNAPSYDSEAEYETVSSKLQPKISKNWIRPLMRIAAVLLIGFSVFYYTSNLNSTTSTLIAEQATIELPDASTVELNAVSNLSFNKRTWSDKREVSLEGEAYFRVAKGSKFDVITKEGKVSVLGTEFNVIQRDDYFEVTCFEGLVAVTYDSKYIELKPTQRFTVHNGVIRNNVENQTAPSWINNESSFSSSALELVLEELQRHYEITIDAKQVDTKQIFTGSFTHNDLDLALKSITLPLGITYTKNDAVIVLKGE